MITLQHVMIGSSVTQIQKMTRGNVFKTQRKTNQTKKTDNLKTELKENSGIREMRKFHLSMRRQIVQCSICYEA